MEQWIAKFIKLTKQEDGVTSIEYAMIAAIVTLAIVFVVRILGDQVAAIIQQVSDGLS